MEKYIRELLQDHDRVIIPNFGGFLKSKGEINTLIFNEFIKFNDGQLINHIAKKEAISIDEASSKVDEFAQQLRSSLSEGKEVEIKGVGVLFTADAGRIRFKSSVEDEYSPEIKKKREPKAEKLIEKKPEKKEEPVKENKPTPPGPEKSAVILSDSSNDREAEKNKPVPVSDEKSRKPVPVPDEKKPVTAKTVSGGDVPSEKSGRIRQPDPRTTPPIGTPPEEDQRKKRKPLFWIIPLLIFLGIIVWVTIDYDNIQGYFNLNSTGTASTGISETTDGKTSGGEMAAETTPTENETVTEDTANEINAADIENDIAAGTAIQPGQSEEINREEQAVPDNASTSSAENTIKPAAEVPATPPKMYHLIAGVFDQKENAVDLVNKLRNEGFYAEIIGYVNNKYYVSYNSFKSKADAKYEWERLKNKNYDAWLYYY